MSSVSERFSLNGATVHPISSSKLKSCHVSELPEDVYQQMLNATQTVLQGLYSIVPDTAGNATYSAYAKVVVNNKVVAEIDNHGWVKSSNALGAKIQRLLVNADTDAGVQSGPLYAKEVADRIAKELGGKVVKASTALTQSQFEAIPQPKVTYNQAAMQQDPMYEQLIKTQQMRAAFLAQQMAQEV